MTQFDYGTINPTTKSGSSLAGDLNSFRDAVNSSHKGATAPSYAVAGTRWIDDSGHPLWISKVFDGTEWIAELAIDSTANRAYPVSAGARQNFQAVGGSANALTLTPAPPLTAYADYEVATFEAIATNTGAATFNVSGVGAKALRKMQSGADVALVAGDIQAGERYFAVYDAAANAGAGAWILLVNNGWQSGGTINGQLTFNRVLSTGTKLLDLQQGYELYSDNTGVYGTSRLWLNTPSTGEVYIGPRSGVGFQLLRVRAVRVEYPEATSFTIGGQSVWHTGNDDVLARTDVSNTFAGNQSITGGLTASSGITTTAGSVALGADAYFYSYNGLALGNVRSGIKCEGSTASLRFWAGGVERGSISSSGNFAVAGVYSLTTSAAANVNVDTAGTFARSTSSLKYKQDIETYADGILKLKKLRPVTYRSRVERDGDGVFAGFIAEEVDAADLKEFVVYDEEGKPDALQYGNMTALLAKALQEAIDKIEALEARLAVLEGSAS
jgi:hypothetical protein